MHMHKFIVSTLLLVAASWAHALEIQPYTASALNAAQQAGKPVVLHFHADWCPTCLAQDKVLQSIKDDPSLPLTVLSVDYDTEKDLKKRFNVRSQSTLIALRGQKEMARSVGDTTPAGIRATLKSAL